MKHLLSLALLLIALTSCGGGGGNKSQNRLGEASMPAPIVIAGNWSISTSSEGGENVTLGGSIQQAGTSVNGTLTMAADPCELEQLVTLTGTVSDRLINLTLEQPNADPISFAGVVSSDGNSLEGAFSWSLGCSIGDASGSFTGVRIPSVSGTWMGEFQPSNSLQIPFSVTAVITQDGSGNLAGTTTLNSPCLSEASLAGTIRGLDVILAGRDSVGDNITFTGTTDNTGTQLRLDYILNGSPSGRCETDTGSGSMVMQ